MKLYKITSLCVAGFFVVGCGSGMPTCKGDDTTRVLEKIFKQQFGDSVKVSFDGFATNETNEAKKQVTCQVMAKVTHTATGRSEEDTIHYTARHTDDGQIYVEITH